MYYLNMNSLKDVCLNNIVNSEIFFLENKNNISFKLSRLPIELLREISEKISQKAQKKSFAQDRLISWLQNKKPLPILILNEKLLPSPIALKQSIRDFDCKVFYSNCINAEIPPKVDLSFFPKADALHLEHVELTDASWDILKQALLTNKLTALHLNFVEITEKKALDLFQIISQNTSLQHLSLQNNSLGSASLSQLFRTLGAHPSLHTLEVATNGIDSDDNGNFPILEAFGELLKENTKLQEVKATFSLFFSCPFDQIIPILTCRKDPLFLDLSENSISDESLEALNNASNSLIQISLHLPSASQLAK
ncbi:MAG: hypothetical protein Tsb0015_14830 [Simkaniaceae bacterium]